MAFGWLRRTCDIDDLATSCRSTSSDPPSFLTRPSRASNNESDMADDKDNKGEDGGELAQGNSKQRPTDTMNVDQKPNDALISKVRACTLP